MAMSVQATQQTGRRTSWPARAAAAVTAPVFVVLVLAGNSLTESVGGPDPLSDLAAQAGSSAARLGLALELIGFVAFAVFAGHVIDVLRRRAAFGTAGAVAVVAATMMLSVKLASGAPYLVGLSSHENLSAQSARILVETNGAAFVLTWLPFALFVGAAAVALRAAGLLGRLYAGVGLGLAVLGTAACLVGVHDPVGAVPVPFLLSLLWTLVLGVRLAWVERDTAGD